MVEAGNKLPPGVTPELAFFLGHQAYADYVTQRINAFEPPRLKAECAQIKLVSRYSIAVMEPPRHVAGQLAPESGQWIDRANVDRCGASGVRSLVIVALGQNRLQAFPMVPGRTIAGPLLQRDAMTPAMVAASQKIRGEDPLLIDTLPVGHADPAAIWEEMWTFVGNSQTAIVKITFVPDGKGGTGFSCSVQ